MFKPLYDYPKSRLKYAIIDNSVTVKIGGAITPSVQTTDNRTRYVIPAATTNPVLGVVVGFGQGEGGKVYKVYTGATSVATAADNVVVAKIGCWYIPAADRNVEFIALANADLGTTTGSLGFGLFALNSDVLLTENTYVVITTAETSVDFVSYGQYKSEARKVVGRFIRVVK